MTWVLQFTAVPPARCRGTLILMPLRSKAATLNTPMMKLKATKDGSYTLYSDSYRQTYHSVFGAETESRHVFLDNSGVRERLACKKTTRVLEVGFGTGLNFFLTADLALASDAPLTYYAFENNLLPAPVLEQLSYEKLLSFPDLVTRVLSWRASLPQPAPHGTLLCEFESDVSLAVIHADACTFEVETAPFDAVYLDAFSPDENPELWTRRFFRRLGSMLAPNACLATYSARRTVRENLALAGFNVEKRPGPPGKREIIVARRL